MISFRGFLNTRSSFTYKHTRRIAGSVLRLNHAVRNILDHTALTVPQAVRLASLNPATVIGVSGRKGSLEKGKDADIALFDERFEPKRTIIAGETVFEA